METVNSKKMPELTEFPSAIHYADGSEEQLLGIVTHDNFDEKRTWLSYQDDWALYYHLSPLRKNLINIFNWGERPLDLLELGAGCGAVTSGLGAIPNLSVTALEGALARAKVIQGRCAGFDNVAIHVCDINEYPVDKKYDVVTLIGVLEYAGRYSKEENPFHALLRKVRSLLKPEGVLLLAIENKLGHKYLNGAEEDHYFSPWEGINDYPNYNGTRTFEKTTLMEMLNETGFPEQKWLYPYPDYKLPSVVLTQNGIEENNFEWLDLFRVTETEPNMAKNPNFDEFSFLSSLVKEKCADKFMNSFLIVAGTDSETLEEMIPSSVLAYRSNGKYRLPQFTVNSFFRSESSGITISRRKESEGISSEYIHHVVEKEELYHPDCINLESELKRAFSQSDRSGVLPLLNLWTNQLTKQLLSPTAEDIKKFRSFSSTIIGTNLYESKYSETAEWIPGKYLDMIPSNILISQDSADKLHIIDQEWQFNMNIPLQFVFDRGLLILYERIPELLPYLESQLNTTLAGTKAGALFTGKDVESLALFERWFQAAIFYSTFAAPLGEQNEIRLTHDLALFLQTVTEYVEQQRFQQAVAVYDKYRRNYYTTPELRNFDQLLTTLKSRMGI